MKLQQYTLPAILALALLVTGCRSSRKAAKDDEANQTTTTTVPLDNGTQETPATPSGAPKASKQSTAAMNKVTPNRQTIQGVRAKINVSLQTGSRMSASGTLKMKRDEIVQISLSAILGIEVGRLELTPEYLLIQDRINHQYVKAVWEGVPQLRNAGINFYTFQALFWDELFVLGKQEAPVAADFDTDKSGSDYVMTPNNQSTAAIALRFLVEASSGLIRQTSVTSSSAGNALALDWTYSDWTKLDGKSFPTQMQMTMNSSNGSTVAQFALSRVQVDESMGDIKTVIDESRYTHVNLYRVLNKLVK
ncbi:MAG: DUF4292 domain-containing protein [Bacteroidaceae bacterium]|nr:DUF4292 domain-containing protein [Bacteroidaceae bacterium]